MNGPRLTLPAVRDCISAGSLANPAWKGLMYFFRDLAAFAAIVVLISLTDNILFLIPLWFVAGLSVSSLFIVGHDAAHGALFKNQRLAWWVGQIAMLPSLHAYSQWVYGHNRIHHGHTIKMEGDFVWRPTSPSQYEAMGIFAKLWHRICWSFAGAGPYYLVEIWLKGMICFAAPNKEARRDRILIIAFALLSSAALIVTGGVWFWVKTALVPFVAFNYTIGFAVYVHHIHDFIPWRKHKDWTPFYGQMLGTVNYHVPAPLNFFLHNIFIHMPHHVNMRVPMYHLPRALEEIKAVYGEYVIERNSMFLDYFKTTSRCKLFDVEKGTWLTYAMPARKPDESPQDAELSTVPSFSMPHSRS